MSKNESENESILENLDLSIKTQEDVLKLLLLYESGGITRDEYLSASFLAHCQTRSNGFNNGYNLGRNSSVVNSTK